DSPRRPKSPKQSTGRASVLSPRTSVLICVLMDSHDVPVCRPTHTDTHRQPRTSCPRDVRVCWRTPTDILCLLNRQPTWAKITRTVHGKGQGAESKDQHADMYTDGQPQTSSVPRGLKPPEQSMGRASVLNPRTSVLICVLMDSHGRPSMDQRADMCTDGQPRIHEILCKRRRTHKDTHGRPVCADGHTRTSCPTWAKITLTVHGKSQRAQSKDQRADMCTNGQPPTHVYVMCFLADTHDVPCVLECTAHRADMCTDGQPRTSSTDVLCVLADTHGRPVCTEQTAHVAKITQTVHGKGQRAESKDQCADIQPMWAKITRTVHGRVSVLSPRTNVLICVLMDSHGRPV
ncbi:unnamed protein product, partial [Brassica rapa]